MLGVINFTLIGLNIFIPMIQGQGAGAPSPIEGLLQGLYPVTTGWPLLTGLIVLLNVLKPGGGATGQ